MPVCVIRNGDGPSVLLMAGTHGDEYEGELSLARLIRRLDPARMKGRVTILPMTNAPAVMAAKRCSPLDGGNLNRAFPGDPNGHADQPAGIFSGEGAFPAPRRRARHPFGRHLHGASAGRADRAQRPMPSATLAQWQLMASLGMPHGFVADNGAASPTSMGAARRAGVIGLSGEFGGGGTATVDSMAITARAIDNLLIALGVVAEPVLGETRRSDRSDAA